jgi:NADPH2:quinone reductase
VKAIQIQQYGGPEVLQLVDIADPAPGDGEQVLTVSAIGINFADTHKAEDSYMESAELPFVPGVEALGQTPDGRRVAALLAGGGYAEQAVFHPALSFSVPDAVSDAAALAVLLQGLTAWHVLRSCARITAGETVVVHAAAGGVGSLAIQLAPLFGAGRVIAVASTDEKRKLALELGADAAIGTDPSVLTDAIRDANGGKRVDVVLEMIGGESFEMGMASLAPLGRLVYYGTAGRTPAPLVDPGALMRRSIGVIGFWLSQLVRQPSLLREPMQQMLKWVADDVVKPVLGGSYKLEDACQAHVDLRARRTTGKLVLIP